MPDLQVAVLLLALFPRVVSVLLAVVAPRSGLRQIHSSSISKVAVDANILAARLLQKFVEGRLWLHASDGADEVLP
eukprot:3591887-Rhodomonas_salina.1